MQVISHRLDVLKGQHPEHLIDLHKHMDDTVHRVVEALIEHLKSDGVRDRFSNWTQDEVPKTYDEMSNGKMNQIFQKKLKEIIDEWEKDQFKNEKESLVQQIRHCFHFLEVQPRSVRSDVTGGLITVPGVDLPPGGVSFLRRIFLFFSWFFYKCLYPFSFERGFLPTDSQASWEEIERSYQWWSSDQRVTMTKLSIKYLSEAAKENVLKPFVKSSLKEAEQYLSDIETQIPKQIKADKMMVEELSNEKRSEEVIQRTYQPILDDTLNIRERVAFFGLREAGAANICSEWLDWNQGPRYLGKGEFATVYRGKMRRHGEEQDVALKVFQEVRLAKTASRVIQEANQLR